MSKDSETTLFETARLRAVQWRVEQADEAFTMYGDPEVGRYIGGHQDSVDDVRRLIEMILERSPTLRPGMGSFPLLLRSTGELVGASLIKPLPGADDQRTQDIEIGWHLARRHWGQGYATEAGHGLLRWGFEALDLTELHAVVGPANAGSLAVVARLGLEPRGPTTSYHGGCALLHFRLGREAWLSRQQESGSSPA